MRDPLSRASRINATIDMTLMVLVGVLVIFASQHQPTVCPMPRAASTGECSGAEVERAAATRRADMAERRLASLEGECRTAKEHAARLEGREREARHRAQAAAAELIKVGRTRRDSRLCLCVCAGDVCGGGVWTCVHGR